MQTPPPSYANIFPSEGATVTCTAFAAPPMSLYSAPTPSVVEKEVSKGIENRSGGGGGPPFLCTSTNPSSFPPPVVDMALLLKTEENNDDILRHLMALREEISFIKSHLTKQSSSSAPMKNSTQFSSIDPSITTPFFNDYGKSDWVRLLLWHQAQIETLSEALRLALTSSFSSASPVTPAVANPKEKLSAKEENKSILIEDAIEQTTNNNKVGDKNIIIHQDVSVKSPRNIVVDVVDLMTAFYNLPTASCGCCREQLPSTFGEELIAAAMGTTSRDLLERYASMLVARLNEGYGVVNIANSTHTNVIVFGTRCGDTATRALAPLPTYVLQQVVERTLFPSEIPAYQITFAACEARHQNHLLKWPSFSRPVPSVVASEISFSSIYTTSCHCKKDEAEKLLCGVRFLWLPLRFLENELRRCEAFGLVTENCRCAIYAGLLLRLRQAIRAKRCLKDASSIPAQPLPAACTAEPFIVELRRLRTSYNFLTPTEKQQLLNAEGIDFSHLCLLQKRLDANT